MSGERLLAATTAPEAAGVPGRSGLAPRAQQAPGGGQPHSPSAKSVRDERAIARNNRRVGGWGGRACLPRDRAVR